MKVEQYPFQTQEKLNKCISGKIKQTKKLGGRSLPRITDIFSGNKTKILIKSNLPNNKNKKWFFLLHKFIDLEYDSQKSFRLFHPLYHTTNINFSRNWDWFKQAQILYKMINKEVICNPKEKIYILNNNNKEEIFFENKENVKNYTPTTNTIPISKVETNKWIRVSKGKSKRKKLKTIKAPVEIWKEQVELKFEKWCYSKKIKLKDIIFFGNKEFKKKKVWTKKQSEWINLNIPVDKFLSTTTNNISKIEDFKTKFFLNYWSHLKSIMYLW